MLSIEKSNVPTDTLLANYILHGSYVDCYTTGFPGRITFPEFIFAFYTTWLFKVERFILTWTVAKPSTDLQARQLADGRVDKFAAWIVEARTENELLLCDFIGRTRSWLMVVPINESQTRLYFGSAVVPQKNSNSLGFGFQILLGFHQAYSIFLLYSAKQKMLRQQGGSR